MTQRQTAAYTCLFVALVLLTFAILGGLPVAFLKDLAWVKAKDYVSTIWGYCPVMAADTVNPTQYCFSFQRPCVVDEHSLHADKSALVAQLVFHVLAWILVALALVTTFLNRIMRTPSLLALLAALSAIIGMVLAAIFTLSTIDIIKTTGGDPTVAAGPGIFLSGIATFLLLVGSAMYLMEWHYVERVLHKKMVVQA
ncbi:hypothetical protein DFS34DRAFT_645266 [Phlyctochytrium arcticum]|nr:hypothetical protein DFS34DRAFT_645266 [Phlyctochytrium arcticum]